METEEKKIYKLCSDEIDRIEIKNILEDVIFILIWKILKQIQEIYLMK